MHIFFLTHYWLSRQMVDMCWVWGIDRTAVGFRYSAAKFTLSFSFWVKFIKCFHRHLQPSQITFSLAACSLYSWYGCRDGNLSICWMVGPPLRSRLKHTNNTQMDWLQLLNWHSWSPVGKSYWLSWSLDLSSSTTSSYWHFTEASQPLLDQLQ